MERTFIFADLAGFSALTETHGDETGADLVERFVGITTGALSDDGRLVGVSGDAVFLVATTPARALEIVSRLFRSVESEPGFPSLRVGMHHGEAAERGEQFYGNAVNVAARVAAHARGGQTLATEPVASAARDAGLCVRSLGRVSLKNLREPLELFLLDVTPGAATEVIDPVCRMRVVPDQAAAHLELGGQEHWFCSRDCLRLFLEERQ
jgi:class 3 adenylate cyclase